LDICPRLHGCGGRSVWDRECFFAPGLTHILSEFSTLLVGEDAGNIERRLVKRMRWAAAAQATSDGRLLRVLLLPERVWVHGRNQAAGEALAMFTKAIAVELAPFGVRVNNLAPGAVETEINRDVIQEIGENKFREWIPAGRVAQSDEMIGPVVFLASDAASYVTGATLYADGGYLQNLVRYRPG
jgi:NAD(P)-dependent dehydrogenase (short-subunit alcohol dehydrogenase family)